MPIHLQCYSMCSKYPSSAHRHALSRTRQLSRDASMTHCSMLSQAFNRCCHNLLHYVTSWLCWYFFDSRCTFIVPKCKHTWLTSFERVMISGMKFTFSRRTLPLPGWRDLTLSMLNIRPDTANCLACTYTNIQSTWKKSLITYLRQAITSPMVMWPIM